MFPRISDLDVRQPGLYFPGGCGLFFSEVYLKAGKRNTFLFLNSAILVEDPVLIGQMNIREYFKENVQTFPIGLGVDP